MSNFGSIHDSRGEEGGGNSMESTDLFVLSFGRNSWIMVDAWPDCGSSALKDRIFVFNR